MHIITVQVGRKISFERGSLSAIYCNEKIESIVLYLHVMFKMNVWQLVPQ